MSQSFKASAFLILVGAVLALSVWLEVGRRRPNLGRDGTIEISWYGYIAVIGVGLAFMWAAIFEWLRSTSIVLAVVATVALTVLLAWLGVRWLRGRRPPPAARHRLPPTDEMR